MAPSFAKIAAGSLSASGQAPAHIVSEAPAPTVQLVQASLDEALKFSESALVCRFNGFWPQLTALHSWISEVWKPLIPDAINIYPCARGFFIVDFENRESRQCILDSGPWFWDKSGLFLRPWYPSFDPSTAVITSAPVWVRLPNLPLHLWNLSSLEAIGNAIGKFYCRCPETEEYVRTTYARICVEMDFSAGFPAEIHLTSKDYVWNQKLDYESVLFRCRSCFETGHLAKNCPKASQKNSARKNHHRSTWWEGAQKEHYTVIQEEYSRENSESQAIGQDRNNSQDEQGESPAQQQKGELNNPSSIDSYAVSNNAENKSSFNSKTDLLDQTSSPTISKRTNTIDREAKTPMSQEPEEMKEMQDKESWKTVEKKKKATSPISPRKTRSQTIRN